MTEDKAKKPLDEHQNVKQPKKDAWLETLALLKKGSEAKTKVELNAENYQTILQKIEQLEIDNQMLKTDNLNHIARLQTMARRHGVEQQQTVKYGGQELARSILTPLGLFKKIVKSPAKNEEIKNYLMGFSMISKQLDQALTDNGIKRIVVKVGDEFNPQFHEAIELVETDAVPKGKIAEVTANGYQLHDRVLTHARVKVAK